MFLLINSVLTKLYIPSHDNYVISGEHVPVDIDFL